MANLKTSFFGSIAGGTMIIDAIAQKNWIMLIAGIATAVTGLMAKDSDTH